jgi:DNA-nicking Smr family endonuclease
MSEESDDFSQPVPLPIDGVLDLHTIQPREVKDVLLAYLEACQEKHILEVRVIHGKGIGNLQRTVHAQLKKHPEVISFVPASELYGGAGATMVKLRTRQS